MNKDLENKELQIDDTDTLVEAKLEVFKAGTEEVANVEAERAFNKSTINMFKPLEGSYISKTRTGSNSNTLYKIKKVFVGNKSGKIVFLFSNDTQLKLDAILSFEKRTDENSFKYPREINEELYEIVDRWLPLRKEAIKKLSQEVNSANSEARTKDLRARKLELSYNAVGNLSPEDFKAATAWLNAHTTSIHFRIPKIDDELSKLDTTGMSIEKADKEREYIERKFRIQEESFKREVPSAVLDRDYSYRYTSKESDTTYRMWNLSGAIRFDEEIGNAPQAVLDLITEAQNIAVRNGHEVKPLEAVKGSKALDSYYFCIMVIRLFDDNINFYKYDLVYSFSGEVPALRTPEPKHELDLPFDDINAYGEIVQ